MSLRVRWLLIGVWVLGFMGLLEPAWADDEKPIAAGTQAAAEAMFREGRDLMQQSRFAEACTKFAESQRLDPGAGTLLNLADCYEKNGQTASAWATYTEAASTAARSGRTDWETNAKKRANQLEPTLSTLTIIVPSNSDVAGLVIERAGARVQRAQWGLPIPVDPGVHPVAAFAPKKQQWNTTISVGPHGAKAVVTVPPLLLEQEEGAVLPVSNSNEKIPQQDLDRDKGSDAGNAQRTWGLVLGGAGVVGLGTGTVFGLLAKSKYDDALNHCDTQNRCSPKGLELEDQARSRAATSTILFSVGAAALIGGGVLYLTAPSPNSTSVAVGATPTAGGATFSMHGLW